MGGERCLLGWEALNAIHVPWEVFRNKKGEI